MAVECLRPSPQEVNSIASNRNQRHPGPVVPFHRVLTRLAGLRDRPHLNGGIRNYAARSRRTGKPT